MCLIRMILTEETKTEYSRRPMEKIQILGICGSLRTASFNKKLLLLARDEVIQQNADVDILDLRELQLPIFDQDIEDSHGMPAGGTRLVEALYKADGVMVANPEYNSSITGALKNAIDWASRAEKNPFANKVIMLIGTSPGAFGAARSSLQTRLILSHLGGVVIPGSVTLPHADKLFTDDGKLKEEWAAKQLKKACSEFVRIARSLRS